MRSILSIALNTYRESVRSKILYSILFFAILIIVVSSAFGVVTIGDTVKVIKDFALFALTLFGLAYIVITGSALLHKELSRKTIFNILSKPVPRYQFLVGKFLGMLLTVSMMILLMTFFLLIFLYFYESKVDILILISVYSILLQMFLLCAVVIFLSSILITPLLSGIITFAVFIAGRSVEFIKNMETTSFIKDIIEKVYYALPHLDKIDISNLVVYGQAVSQEQLVWNTIYTFSYSAVMLALANIFFSYREFRE